MPKMKTHKGSAKRFKKTGSGKLKTKRAFRSHILTKKSPKRKRKLRKEGTVKKCDAKRVNEMLPYK
ncbi:MAG: 50S ribosomal protein L35 [Bacteroidales bacterium]|jgi:large subunit ribosomal protein L35|nr:50S ribosomal protein L35 [Bacteroidales bacterium]